eukprot:Skav233583  [mRNA]  locus=scaffold2520:203728:218513:- [translate_table: standard]
MLRHAMRRKVDLNAYRCAPPVTEYAFTDAVFLRAARDIEPYEELTQFYCSSALSHFREQKRPKKCSHRAELQGSHASGQVPLVHQRFASELQGVVETAEAAVLKAVDCDVTPAAWHWALWPLVPALQQLAARLRLDGRLEERRGARAPVNGPSARREGTTWESLDLFRRADEVVRFLPNTANQGLHSELLMTSRTDETLAENRWLVAAGFGHGLQDASAEALILNAPQAVELRADRITDRLDPSGDSAHTTYDQLKRPQKGGPVHGEDAFSYSQLLERFESDRKDFHPLSARERSTAADMCRYMDQRLQAQLLGTRHDRWDLRDQKACEFPQEEIHDPIQFTVLDSVVRDRRSRKPVWDFEFSTQEVYVEEPWAAKEGSLRKMKFINAYNGTDFTDWYQGKCHKEDTMTIEETAYETLGKPEGSQKAIEYFNNGVDCILQSIEEAQENDWKSYIYMYTAHPDKHMHELGIAHHEVTQVLCGISDGLERLWRRLKMLSYQY